MVREVPIREPLRILELHQVAPLILDLLIQEIPKQEARIQHLEEQVYQEQIHHTLLLGEEEVVEVVEAPIRVTLRQLQLPRIVLQAHHHPFRISFPRLERSSFQKK